MDDEDVEDLLSSAGWGVLSLARDDEPYSIPISFGYTGTEVYFAFLRADPPNTKFEFVRDGAPARLLVTDVRAMYDWQSVAVTGSVRAVTRRQDLGEEGMLSEVDEKPDQKTERGRDWGELLDTLEENVWFSSDYERAEPVSELQGWRLEPDQIQGVEIQRDNGQ
jgi:nitroimidazol reductase NimA-like FMN-containing flavoprotein (pyridoxamine 5'-phosphate oxidase superfamily)